MAELVHWNLPRYQIVPTGTNDFAYFFDSIMGAGAVLSSIVLAIVLLSSGARRNAAWINLTVTIVIYSLSYLVLLVSGQQFAPVPSHGVCFAQAVMIYGAPPLVAAAVFSLVFQLWMDIRASVLGKSLNRPYPVRTAVLVLTPYAFWVLIVGNAIAEGIRYPGQVVRLGSSAYCVITTGAPGQASAVVVAVIITLCTIFAAIAGRTIHRMYLMSDRVRADSVPSMSLMIRIATFIFMLVAAMATCGYFISQKAENELPNVLLAFVPVTYVVIFGTQQDILYSWRFWRCAIPVAPPRDSTSSRFSIDSTEWKAASLV